MSQQLTIHILSSVPYSNLNRDDSGTPKRILHGGALRAVHSSQAIKRGARVAYQERTEDKAIRSGNHAEMVANRAREINPSLDEAKAFKDATELVKKLGKVTKENKTLSMFLSDEELESMAGAVAGGVADIEGSFDAYKTGSLAIAGFGRMFAEKDAKEFSVEAAVAVSPGVTTHAAQISTDYFTTVDDYGKQGATFLGVNQFTSGVFYRTVTIDKDQLRKSWTGLDSDRSVELLTAFIDSLLYAAPKGKKNSTNPYTMPALVIAEEQKHRVAYDFETPVLADETGGFVTPSVRALASQVKSSRHFDPSNFEGLFLAGGTYADIESLLGTSATKDEIIDAIVSWIKE